MDNREIARHLERIGALLELTGDNPFKARAYYRAAQEIGNLTHLLDTADVGEELRNIPGIGEALEKKILELLRTGKIQYLEDLESTVSPDFLEMLRIPGLGPRKLRTIIDTLGIGSIGELEYACLENRVRLMKGFGEKTQQNILKGIDLVKRSRGFLLFSDAMHLAEQVAGHIQNIAGVAAVKQAGTVRRCAETVQEITIVAEMEENSAEAVMQAIAGLPFWKAEAVRGDRRIEGMLEGGVRCTVYMAEPRRFPLVLHAATGSAEYLAELSAFAASRGFALNDREFSWNEKILAVSDESGIYDAMGVQFIPPELRENRGEIDAAARNMLPELIAPEDIRGILHVHTEWSDGSDSIERMALAAKAMGMEYIGIADHSVSATYAGGVTEDEVRRQWDEIDRCNEAIPEIRILKGVECDIRSDGSLDYRDSILEGFDFVIASVHTRFKMEKEEMTERIVRAVSSPHVTILGHPTGRILLARDPYAVDLERVIESCGEFGTSVELNADPHRFDLDWRYHRFATEHGVKISIDPDSHSVEGLSIVYYGINIARKGWLRKEDVLNTRPPDEINPKKTPKRAKKG